MKVIIKDFDVVITSDLGTVEVGNIPKGTSLNVIRWNGEKIIDISKLTSIWVEYKDRWLLHCIEVPNSQLVKMQYKDRRKLYNDNGVYRIKSNEQIQDERNYQYRRSHYPQISDQMGLIMKYLATKNDLPNELQVMINDIDKVKIQYPKAIEK